MPYCTSCGAQTGSGDRFCPHCGGAQAPGAAPVSPPPPAATGAQQVRPNIAALLCYIPTVGWLASIFFLTAEAYRRNRYIHFHALQGLFLFVASVLLDAVFGFGHHIVAGMFFHANLRDWGLHAMLEVAIVVCQIVGIVRTAKSEPFHVPILGDLAERSMV